MWWMWRNKCGEQVLTFDRVENLMEAKMNQDWQKELFESLLKSAMVHLRPEEWKQLMTIIEKLMEAKMNLDWQENFFDRLLKLAKNDVSKEKPEEEWKDLMELKRKHIPRSLLRFRPIQNEEDLKFRKSEIDGVLYFCDVREMKTNDPFDSSLLSMQSADPIYAEVVGLINTDVKNSGYITCFNDCHEDNVATLPMWALYARDHKGCCMKYDKVDSSWSAEWQDALFPMKYRHGFQNFLDEFKNNDDSWEINQKSFCKYVMLNKFDSWSYENEWRVILDKNLIRKLRHKLDIRVHPYHNIQGLPLSDHSAEKIMVDSFKSMLDTDGTIINYTRKEDEPEFKGVSLNFRKPSQIIFGRNINDDYKNKLIDYCRNHPDKDIRDMKLLDITFKDNRIELSDVDVK